MDEPSQNNCPLLANFGQKNLGWFRNKQFSSTILNFTKRLIKYQLKSLKRPTKMFYTTFLIIKSFFTK